RNNLSTESKPENAKNLIVSKPAFDFYDFNAKAFIKFGKHFIDFNAFRSADYFKDQYDISYKIKNNATNEELFRQVSKWDNKVFGLNYKHQSDDHDMAVSLYKTEYSSTYDIWSNLVQRRQNVVLRDTVTVLNNNFIRDYGAKFVYLSKGKYQYLAGVEYVHHQNELYMENNQNPIFEINKSGAQSSIFTEISLGKKEGLFVQPALRSTLIHNLSTFYILPQIYLSYGLNDHWILKTSAGKQVQYIRQLDHENLLGQRQQFFALSNGTSVPVGKGFNFMTGSWKSWGKFSLDVEGYFRTLDGAIIHATQTPGLRSQGVPITQNKFRLFHGDSRVYGVDFSLIYESSGLFSMLNYTLSKSENRFREIFRNQYFPSAEDSRHQLKWINSYKYSRFEFSINYIASSGRPYLDLSALNNLVDRNNLIIGNYIKNLNDYHRIDAGVTYNLEIFHQKAKLGFSVFNLTNHTNVKYRQFVYQVPPPAGSGLDPVNTILGSDVSQLDRTFNVSFGITLE
ncbi:MAG: TonB-dependent receptor, partial [Saprospiraceae bacterium]|nr:TonB-dependent receptor [Saprospiraceae bacterium]